MSESTYNTDDSVMGLRPNMDEHFPCIEKLKRSELDGLEASLWDELCLTAAEEDITPLNNENLIDSEEFKHKVALYQSLKLSSNKQLTFPNKNALKRRSASIGLWVSMAAAAAVILLLAIPFLFSDSAKQPNSQQSGQPLVVDSHLSTQPKTSDTATTNSDIENTSPKNNTHKQIIVTSRPARQKNYAQVNPTVEVENKNADRGLPVGQTSAHEVHTMPLKPIDPLPTQTAMVASAATDKLDLQRAEEAQQRLPDNESEDVSLLRTLAQRVVGGKKASQHVTNAENLSPIDWVAQKGIVGLNRLLDNETVVVKEYDSTGKLTLYAVQSSTISFQKTYDEP